MYDQHVSRSVLTQAKRVVIKVGSALITDGQTGVNTALIGSLVMTSIDLLKTGRQVVLVSSGAIAEGMAIMKWQHKPSQLSELQALAALGQMSLVQEYESHFEHLGYRSAQVLLTHDEKSNYRRYINASSTLKILLGMGVVPVINENDVVADEEIRFGDNDQLAALACNLIGADVLLILTDQDGLFSANPRVDPDAILIENASSTEGRLLDLASTQGGKLGSGGMHTKVLAARQAAIGGTHTVILNGRQKMGVHDVLQAKPIGTFLFSPHKKSTVVDIFKQLNTLA